MSVRAWCYDLLLHCAYGFPVVWLTPELHVCVFKSQLVQLVVFAAQPQQLAPGPHLPPQSHARHTVAIESTEESVKHAMMDNDRVRIENLLYD